MGFWVWTTKSEYFLEDPGASATERKVLDPKHNKRIDASWSCAKGTRSGDLVLVYRAGGAGERVYKDIAYLLQATSDAFPLSEEGIFSWPYGCTYQPQVKLGTPLSLAEMKFDPFLSDWGPVKAGFMGGARSVPDDTWRQIIGLIDASNPGFGGKATALEVKGTKLKHVSEKAIEDSLARNLDSLKPHGYEVRLHEEVHPVRGPLLGRQYYCEGDGTRIDLLCRYMSRRKRFLVIEVKKGRATPSHVGQIKGYMDWVEAELGGSAKGLLVTQGKTVAFENGRRTMPKGITQIDVADLKLG